MQKWPKMRNSYFKFTCITPLQNIPDLNKPISTIKKGVDICQLYFDIKSKFLKGRSGTSEVNVSAGAPVRLKTI